MLNMISSTQLEPQKQEDHRHRLRSSSTSSLSFVRLFVESLVICLRCQHYSRLTNGQALIGPLIAQLIFLNRSVEGKGVAGRGVAVGTGSGWWSLTRESVITLHWHQWSFIRLYDSRSCLPFLSSLSILPICLTPIPLGKLIAPHEYAPPNRV